MPCNSNYSLQGYIILVGFGRACAPLCCAHPSFCSQWCAPPPTHRSSVAFYSEPKIKIIHWTWATPVEGFFLTPLPRRPENIKSATASIQSSELGPPTTSPARECCSPPLDPRGVFCTATYKFFIEPPPDTQRTERQGKRVIWVVVCCYLLWATPPPLSTTLHTISPLSRLLGQF